MATLTSYHEPDLLARVAGGDEAAFAEVFEHYRAKIFHVARKILKTDVVAEDALQEIFLTVWTHRHKLPGISNFTSWLNTIARNYLVDKLRRQNTEMKFVRESMHKHSAEPDNLFDTITWNELHAVLLQAVQLLSPQQQKVFELDRFEGMKHAEIAEAMGISVNTVKNHMKAALKNIRTHFAASGHDLDLLLILLLTLR